MHLLLSITKLEIPEFCGDWHDRPMRWVVRHGAELQKFPTKKEAKLFARAWRRLGDLAAAIDYYVSNDL